ncbi:MAG: hypothetical protein WDN25_05345 [Acetobacteraceae bacterium]
MNIGITDPVAAIRQEARRVRSLGLAVRLGRGLADRWLGLLDRWMAPIRIG